jgi:hypothetical protein
MPSELATARDDTVGGGGLSLLLVDGSGACAVGRARARVWR